MPPGMPPGGPPPGPPGPPPPPPGGALGASPKPSVYSDLSVSMPPQWQLVDVAARNLQSALQTGGFYRTPTVYAAIKQIHHELTRLIGSYSSGDGPQSEDTAARRSGAPGGESFDDHASPDNEPQPVDSTPEL
jgi:hypothetical protein